MENQNSYSMYANEYQNFDTTKISTILLKDGTILKINNQIPINTYAKKSFNRNISDSSLPVNNPNNLAKVRKFNSFSSNIKYKSNFNRSNQNNGFYVIPITNANRKLLAIKVPETEQNIDYYLSKRYVENITFQVSPKKYAYKPYKLPKRKNNIILTNSKQNYSYYCSTSGVNKNANK